MLPKEKTGMIKAVLFDLDETVILRSGAIRSFIKDQYARFAPALRGLSEQEFTESFLTTEKNGVIAKDLVYPELVRSLGIDGVSPDALLEDYRQRYPNYASPSPGAIETIRAVREAGLRTGIVSNGNVRVQNAKIDAIGLRDAMDVIVISEEVGIRKPDPAIFELATSKLDVDSESALFVGDNPEVDIVGAANAGLQTAWFRNGANWPPGVSPRADVDIDVLSEILSYPGK